MGKRKEELSVPSAFLAMQRREEKKAKEGRKGSRQ